MNLLSLLYIISFLPIQINSVKDQHTDSVLAGFLTEFMSDSELQLVVDLDLIRSLFGGATLRFESNFRAKNESFLHHLLTYVDTLHDYDVSVECITDISHFIWSAISYSRSALNEYNCTSCSCDKVTKSSTSHEWIFDILDAIGKVPAGVFDGNNLWIGSWSTCRKISVVKNRQGQRWSGQYCLASVYPFQKNNPFLSLRNNKNEVIPDCKFINTSTSKSTENNGSNDGCFELIPLVRYGLCTPDSCTNYDVKKILKFFYKTIGMISGYDSICDVQIECRNNLPQNQLTHDKKSLAVLFGLMFIAILIAIGTIYDYTSPPEKLREADCEKNWLFLILQSFSLYTNGKNILRTEKHNDQIGCLHGTRVCSMLWIILGHSHYYLIASLAVDNLLSSLIKFPQNFMNSVIVQAALAVDSFFYLSGMLTSYLFMKKFSKMANKGKSIFSPEIWSLFYIHRYMRLTPVYLVVMILDLTLFTHVSDGPFWRPIEMKYCRISWWTNLLYLNNLVLQKEDSCMAWTWYLANDMQFHIFSPIILIALYKYTIAGIALCILLIVSSSLIHVITVLMFDYPPAPILTAQLEIAQNLNTYWIDVYIKPYIRCNPYIIGLLAGFILYKITLRPKIPSLVVIIGWTLSTILGIYSVFGLYGYAKTGEISQFHRIFYASFGRVAYATSLAWVTIACATGYGGAVNTLLSWKAWIPLSRITFCAYLIHPILLQIYYLSRPQPLHFTGFYQMAYLFIVAVLMAYFTGFLLSLSFEVPTSIIENRIIDQIMKRFVQTGKKSEELEEMPVGKIEVSCTDGLHNEELH